MRFVVFSRRVGHLLHPIMISESQEDNQAQGQSSWNKWFQKSDSNNITPGNKLETSNLDSKSFAQFCDNDESIVFLGPVWKRRGLSCHLRILILTSQPRLLYVDQTDMTLKGEVPWTADEPIELLVSRAKPTVFDVLSPLDGGRSYHFEVFSGSTTPWETMITTALNDQAIRKGKQSKKAKTKCSICEKQLGLMRRGYSCDRCKHMVCSECSEDAHLPSKDPTSTSVDQKKSDHGVSKRWCEDCIEEALYITESVSLASSSSTTPSITTNSSSKSSWLGGMGFSSTSRSTLDDSSLSEDNGTELTLRKKPSTPPPVDKQTNLNNIDEQNEMEENVKNGKKVFQKHNESLICNGCQVKFSTHIRRHHCRACGLLFCNTCSSATFPLEAYDMYPQRVCDSCAWTLVRAMAKVHAGRILGFGCALCCWSRCFTSTCAERWFPREKAVFTLRKIASPFGPLWGRFKLKFLLRDRGEGKRSSGK